MPTLIYYDQNGYQSAQREAERQADRFTDLVAQYTTLNLPNAAPLATADLPALMADPTAWLVARLLGNTPFELNGLPIKADKVLELVERPAGFDAFINAVQEEAAWLHSVYHVQGPQMLRAAASYAVGASGQVSLSAAATQQLQSTFQHYATTAAQETLLTDLASLSVLINRLRTKYAQGQTLPGFLEKVLVTPADFGNSVTDVRPAPDFIQQFAR